MSVLQQVLSDARKLATRLRDHDNSADNLLTQAQGMFKQVESMKEYCEEMNQLNEVANNRPRGALIHSIQQENRYIRELQEENKELRLALEEQQNVMELIMSKYREQVAKLLSSGTEGCSADTSAMQRKLGANIERVSEMVCVMRRAAQLDEDQSCHYQQLVTTLALENKGLREMLQIAIRSGSVNSPETLDVDTQTDAAAVHRDTDTMKLNPHFSASDTTAVAATAAAVPPLPPTGAAVPPLPPTGAHSPTEPDRGCALRHPGNTTTTTGDGTTTGVAAATTAAHPDTCIQDESDLTQTTEQDISSNSTECSTDGATIQQPKS